MILVRQNQFFTVFFRFCKDFQKLLGELFLADPHAVLEKIKFSFYAPEVKFRPEG